MNTRNWLARVANGATVNAISTRAGFPTSTITRQLKRGGLSAEVVVKIARAYGGSVLEGLVACGHITASEAQMREMLSLEDALREATDLQLLQELIRRVDTDGALAHPTLVDDIDTETIMAESS